MTVKMIIEALTALPKIFEGIREIAAKFDELIDSITERNINKLKSEVSEKLGEIGNAKSNKERQKLIAELNDKLSK